MGFEIIWSEFAENRLDEIFEYYNENASNRVARNLIQNLINEPNRLVNSPFIGQVEALIEKRETYRYLIYKSYKIIYSVDEKKGLIKVADVFDTRQDPNKIEELE